jgi:hypothetical protein
MKYEVTTCAYNMQNNSFFKMIWFIIRLADNIQSFQTRRDQLAVLKAILDLWKTTEGQFYNSCYPQSEDEWYFLNKNVVH